MPPPKAKRSTWQQTLLLAGTTFLFTGLLLGLNFTDEFGDVEMRSRDFVQRVGRKLPPDPEVVVLAVDSASRSLEMMPGDLDRAHFPWTHWVIPLIAERLLEAVSPGSVQLSDARLALRGMKQTFPWPRWVYVLVMERLFQAGARVVAFDFHFDPPNEGDGEFSRALEDHAAKAIIGVRFDTVAGQRDEQLVLPDKLLPGIQKGSPLLGIVSVKPDPDGVVRQIIYRTTVLAWNGLAAAEGEAELLAFSGRIAQKAGWGDLIPADHQLRFFRYSSPTTPHSIFSIFLPDHWEKNFKNGAYFKDKVVLIGPYGNWTKDELVTPIGIQPGPQIHLSALNALRQREFLHLPSVETDLLFILVAGVLALLLGRFVSHALIRVALFLALAGGYLAAVFVLYDSQGLLLCVLSPPLALLLSGGTYLGMERLFEYRERLRVRRTLEQYVSKDVVKEVLDNPASYLNTLGGARKKVAILFSDVRSFTTITERSDPEALVTQLNEYFTEMVHLVFRHSGTLDKFIGDAVMASWGAIEASSGGPAVDAERAVRAGLAMQRAMPRLNAAWTARGLSEFRVGIGINFGEAICAKIGSAEKQEFTSIGDTVNLASRLEGATKLYRAPLMIGEEMATLVRDKFTLRTVDLLRVKGRVRPVAAFAVLDLAPGESAPAWLPQWEKAVTLYRDQKFVEAETLLQTVAQAVPDDWLTGEYLRRVEELQIHPPAADWDGVHTMTTK